MITIRRTRILDRDQAIAGIATIRQEWQDTAGGESLLDMQGSVGLLLADLTQAIGLTPEETTQALGVVLANELETYWNLSVSVGAELLQITEAAG